MMNPFMTKEDWLELAVKIWKHAVRVYPDAFIAGGYLRDIDNGHKPKDLNIFTYEIPIQDAEYRTDLQRDEEYLADSRIDVVTRFSEFKVPVDIVHLSPGIAN